MRRWLWGGVFVALAACGGQLVPDGTATSIGPAGKPTTGTGDQDSFTLPPQGQSSSSSAGVDGGTPTNNDWLACPLPSYGSCTGPEVTGWQKCVAQNCVSQYGTAFGLNWKLGDYAGAGCPDYAACNAKCACNDAKCTADCAPEMEKTPPGMLACGDDLFSLADCEANCPMPSCLAAAYHDCARLEACCDKITDASAKASCAGVLGTRQPESCNTTYAYFAGFVPGGCR